jgi:hypothetical protein
MNKMSTLRLVRNFGFAPSVILFTLLSCSEESGDGSPGPQAGTSSAQGGNATGGVPAASGGVASAGKANGGSPSTGGTSTTGGTTNPPATGGTSPTGGSAGSSTGGASGGNATGGNGGPTGGVGGGGTAGGASGGASAGGGAGGAAPTAGTSSTDATIVPDPSWACGMADGVPPPTRGTLVFKASLKLGEIHDVGEVQYGHRRVLDVTGGTLTGDKVSGTVLTGGLDLELELSNGSIELEQINIFRTSDNALIFMRTCGFAPAGDSVTRIVPDIEVANSSSLSWLNTGKFAGTRVVNEAAKTIELEVYDVSDVAAAEPKIQIKDPADAKQQPWECSKETGSRGASVFTETVTLGSSLSVGQSKRGNRNIIPITGGTVSGRVKGKVLPGGGDYQSSAGLDAKYTLEADDGELIVIRNCGPFGALIPQFEARVDGPYAFLNANTFLSSDPGGASGGVSITFYERQ